MLFKVFLFAFLLFFCLISVGQTIDKSYISSLEKDGETAFDSYNFNLAVKKYQKLYQIDSTNNEYCLRYAICEIETKINVQHSLLVLHKLLTQKYEEQHCYYNMGRAYMYLYRFTEAMDMFYRFKTLEDVDDDLLREVDRSLEMCRNAMEIMNDPVNVTFENLGPNVNSSMDDFNPFVPDNEEFIVFSSNKKYDPNYNSYLENVYMSRNGSTGWEFSENLYKINIYDNERVVGMTPDGRKMFVCDNLNREFGDILCAERKGKNFAFIADDELAKGINTKDFEMGASMTEDGNTVYFSSDRPGGNGGMDIYIIRRIPGGPWAEPQILSNSINSSYDDNYPMISPDGKVLYFASKGHNSIGGYDLFVSYWNDITCDWTKPINLGYPLNTTDDNTTISFAGSKRYAYIAANRKEGYGGLDIYRVTFSDMDEQFSLIKGGVYIGTAALSTPFKGDNLSLDISVYDEMENLYGKYIYNNNTGRFIAILPKGKYRIEVIMDGYKTFSESFSVNDKNLFDPEIDKNVYLVPVQ